MAFKPLPTSTTLYTKPTNNETLSHTTTESEDPKDASNGRWTHQEHKKFIEVYGRKWKKIERYIGSRTSTQIRSHAQKYFIKLGKSKSKAGAAYHENSLVNAEEKGPSDMLKKQCPEKRAEGGRTPFLISIHKTDKQNEQKAISQELNELGSNAWALDNQLKEFIGMGVVCYNMQYLLWQSAGLMSSLLGIESKVSSKKQIIQYQTIFSQVAMMNSFLQAQQGMLMYQQAQPIILGSQMSR